ncbi:MAG: pyridoxal phosphate-dependent decarboxylase family protein [Promethearchaeota archaeon]
MARKKVTLPEKGLPYEEVLGQMKELRKGDARWQDGKVFSLVYHVSDEFDEFCHQAHLMYFHENALSPIAFPSLKQYEAEVVSMAVDLFGGDRRAMGTMTTGGTESILMAVKTYRDWARETKPEVKKPEMVIPETAHAAFRKASHYFDVRIVYAPVDPDTYRVDLDAVRAAISPNTIFIVGSAFNYPKGVMDPIGELGAIARENDVGLHVDACLGGFILPWLEKLGQDIAPWDFRVPGVTSLSADIHKYGFVSKGASVVLYRNQRFLKHQFFAETDWSGGIYISPSMSGTRRGGNIAEAWAAMKAMGADGYLEAARKIKEASDKIKAGINAIPEMHVMGEPEGTVFAFTSDSLNPFVIGEKMEEKGWDINYLQNPAALHVMIVSTKHLEVADQFLADLRESVEFVKANPNLEPMGNAAVYGMAATLPEKDRSQLKKVVLGFLVDQYRL